MFLRSSIEQNCECSFSEGCPAALMYKELLSPWRSSWCPFLQMIAIVFSPVLVLLCPGVQECIWPFLSQCSLTFCSRHTFRSYVFPRTKKMNTSQVSCLFFGLFYTAFQEFYEDLLIEGKVKIKFSINIHKINLDGLRSVSHLI